MKKAMINTMKNPKYDNLFTPEKAVMPLLKHFASEIPYYKKYTIWECCDPGGSAITSVLKSHNFDVISTDITTGFDFLSDVPNFEFDAIITNPPYSKKNKFLERCFQYFELYGKPFALLLPLTALESIDRGDLFSRFGINVIVLNKRIDFTGQGDVWFNTSWFFRVKDFDNRLFFEKVVEE